MGGLEKLYPQTKVLSRDSSFRRDNGRSPYGDYDQNGDIYSPLSFRSSQYHPRESVIRIEINGNFKAYPFVELFQQKSPLEDVLGGKQIIVEFNLETRNGVIRDAKSNVLPSINAFWFALYAFHPEIQIFSNSN